MKILIADDDIVVQHILSSILQNAEHETELASTGKECIQKVETAAASGAPYQAIFLDLHLPDQTGSEVLSIIRPLTKAKVIMLSANTKQELTEFAPNCRPDDFIEKPFTAEDVMGKLL
jgi:CheY-like chemotaxis protein